MSAALTERARQVAEATRLPVAFLDGTGAPLRIDATTEPVEGGHNHTSTTAHYPDGVTLSVRANLPGQVPAEDPANVRTAASGAGLFTGGTLVADGVRCPATGRRTVPGGPVDGWLATVRGMPDTPAVRLPCTGAGYGPDPTGSPCPGPRPVARVPLLADGRPLRVEPVTAADGTATGVRSTYENGTVLWLLTGRVRPDAAARLALPGTRTIPGPEVFVRVDGHARTAQQRRTAQACVRVVDLWGTRSLTLVLLTAGRPQGPAPRILLAPCESAGATACATGTVR
ncbi:hypothetical protein ACFVYP_36475 [Kitasatospora sp. NPDC058201]|uniref:hypothetical protein n=1 Tax=unclassified Kitasatospora TaxID=2633591 RepID=UPI00365E5E22